MEFHPARCTCSGAENSIFLLYEELRRRNGVQLRQIISDVSASSRGLERHSPDIIFHAGADKLPLMEMNPDRRC
jgi:FlaA1/EpsC-like NDP-sugar epimerase